jgi:DNA-binding Xre family transcriptional regulator
MTCRHPLPAIHSRPLHKLERVTANDGYGRVAQDTWLTYSTVERWVKNDVTRADFPILSAWCKYLGVGVGHILEYVPDDEQ